MFKDYIEGIGSLTSCPGPGVGNPFSMGNGPYLATLSQRESHPLSLESSSTITATLY
jgi:hypothetical protein